jgi:threonyl-tRNA synthetase
VFCRPEHIFEEVQNCLAFVRDTYGLFGFEYTLNLATRPEPFLGTNEVWDQAEGRLRDALDSTGERWTVDEGGGAFYGPKIDITLTDALGRHHQTATIQLDFQMPERFDLTYTDEAGETQRPVIIHRAMLGSLERFFAILCEHTGGKWPLWLSPRQVAVCSVSQQHAERAAEVHAELKAAGIHADLECGDESLGKRLRRIRSLRYNYTVVIGDSEVEGGGVTPKERDSEANGVAISLEEFIGNIHAAQNAV